MLIIGMIVLYFSQNKMLYVPEAPSPEYKYPEMNPPGFRSPTEHNMDYEDVLVLTEDNVRLRGWFIKQSRPLEHETIIYFHENAGNIGFRLPNMQKMFEKWETNILIVGYRGYGHSEGTPTEEGLKLDATAVLDWAYMNKQIDKSKIFIFGRSLGGAVALYLATQRKESIQGLILENTFTSVPDMVDHIFPVVSALKGVVLRINWNSLDLIKNIDLPMLFISGRIDQIVPPIHMDRLYEMAKRSTYKDMYKIEAGTHNESWLVAGDEYFYRIKDFIDYEWIKKKHQEKYK